MSKTIDNSTAARIACMFGRQDPSRARTVEEIARDALQLAELGRQARGALERKKSPARQVRAATAIAARYGARVVDSRDLEGMVLGLKFHGGLYSSGFRNLFYVA
jgi:gamma-glutamylcysteine synthetase